MLKRDVLKVTELITLLS